MANVDGSLTVKHTPVAQCDKIVKIINNEKCDTLSDTSNCSLMKNYLKSEYISTICHPS